jgi:gentisate 1,2-dioxygenase
MHHPVGRVIGASAERLDAGASSPVVQETASSVYHVIEGSGFSEVNGVSLRWEQGDTFCIPAWHRYQHFADGAGTVYLYRFDDRPMLRALGFYRVEGVDVESYVSN